jgi:hypothetical protein
MSGHSSRLSFDVRFVPNIGNRRNQSVNSSAAMTKLGWAGQQNLLIHAE